MNPNSGTVGATPAETMLQQNAAAQWSDYTSRYLPVQQHLADVVDQMGKSDSWENKEAEGKGNEDVASEFAKQDQQRTATDFTKGINVGSSAFKMGVTGAASAEAEAKGAAVNQGQEQIRNEYLSGLNSIASSGQQLAGAATGGLAVAGEVGSREAIADQQVSNAQQQGAMSAAGIGIGAIGAALTGMPTTAGATSGISGDSSLNAAISDGTLSGTGGSAGTNYVTGIQNAGLPVSNW